MQYVLPPHFHFLDLLMQEKLRREHRHHAHLGKESAVKEVQQIATTTACISSWCTEDKSLPRTEHKNIQRAEAAHHVEQSARML
jgi:hypothetical protein